MAGADNYVFNKAPTVADFPQFNGSWINNLPNDFWQGQQYGRERQLQTMFQPGSQGDQALARGDYLGALRQIAQAGGAQSIAPLLPQFMGISAAQQLMGGDANPGGGAPAPQPPPQPRGAYGSAPFAASSSTNGTGPANLGGNPAIGSDNQGETTVRSLFPGDTDTPQEIMDRVATVIGARPSNGMSAADAPLTPQQAQRAQQIIQKRTGGKAVAQSPVSDASTNQPRIETSSSEVASNLQSPGSSPTIGPAASANSPNNRAVPQGPSETTGQESGATGLLPGDSMATLKNLRAAQADQERKAKAASVFNKELSTRFENSANNMKARADAMEGRLAKQQETQYGINVKKTEAYNASEVERGAKRYDAIARQGEEATRELDKTRLAKSLLSSPDYVSGFGEKGILNYRKIIAQLDPSFHGSDAQAQEVVRKFWSDSLRSKLQAFSQSGVGRIMLSEVRIMEKANANQENTVASNRTLAEIDHRANQVMADVSDLANRYNGGRLDPGFDQVVRDHIKQHPMFSDEEIKNPKLLGAPDAPQGLDAGARAEWVRRMGLKSGDAIRMPNGTYKYVK